MNQTVSVFAVSFKTAATATATATTTTSTTTYYCTRTTTRTRTSFGMEEKVLRRWIANWYHLALVTWPLCSCVNITGAALKPDS